MTVEEAAKVLGVSRAHAYELANTGELPTVKLGRRLIVPTIRLKQLLGMDESTTTTPKAKPVIVSYVWSDGVTTTEPTR